MLKKDIFIKKFYNMSNILNIKTKYLHFMIDSRIKILVSDTVCIFHKIAGQNK